MTMYSSIQPGGDHTTMLVASTQLDTTHLLAAPEGVHVAQFLTTRRPSLPRRTWRAWRAAIGAARAEWRHRDTVVRPAFRVGMVRH